MSIKDEVVGGKENSVFGTIPVDGGVFELFELLGLIEPVVDPPPPPTASFTPHDHLFEFGAKAFRPFVAVMPEDGL